MRSGHEKVLFTSRSTAHAGPVRIELDTLRERCMKTSLSPTGRNRPPKPTRRFDVLGLGCVAVDEFLYVKSWPPQDAKTPVLRRDRQCGGLTATALVAATRLGVRCAYAGVLGTDEQSRFVIEALRREGVNTRHLAIRAGVRPVVSSIIVDESAGTRNIFYGTDGVAGAGPNHPPAHVIRSSRVLLVDRFGMAGMIRAARVARAAGVAVVADLESSDVPGFDRLFRLVDHLVVSQEFALALTGLRHPASAVAQWMSQKTLQAVVVTCGARGAWFQERGWRLPTFCPAFPVKVVDTTGCGDVFHGAYAAGLARGLPLAERVRLASASAAIKATQPGGQAGIPTWTGVNAFLRSHR